MKLILALILATCPWALRTHCCPNSFPALLPPNAHADYGPRTEPSDCLGKSVRDLIYRYEGYVPNYPEIRPGCEVRYEDGQSPMKTRRGFYSDRQTLKYFVMDADGSEQVITENSTVSLDLTDSSRFIRRAVRWHQVCFPQQCYQEDQYFEWECSCNALFDKDCPNQNLLDNFHLGHSVNQSSESVYCHPERKPRLPLFTPLKHARNFTRIHEYDDFDFARPHASYNYWLEYSLPGDKTHKMGCELREPFDTPGELHRTFYFKSSYGLRGRTRIPWARAMGYGRLRSGSSGPTHVVAQDLCFPRQCFPIGVEPPCETEGQVYGLDYGLQVKDGNYKSWISHVWRFSKDCSVVQHKQMGSNGTEQVMFCWQQQHIIKFYC